MDERGKPWGPETSRTRVPGRRDQRRKGCPPSCDATLYAERNVAQRRANRMKQWRGVAPCYEKRAASYLGVMAAPMIWPIV